MIPLIFASILSCSDANWIIDGARTTQMDAKTRAEIILEVMKSTEDGCQFTESNRQSRR